MLSGLHLWMRKTYILREENKRCSFRLVGCRVTVRLEDVYEMYWC